MAEKMVCVVPKEGADLSIRVTKERNICELMARQMLTDVNILRHGLGQPEQEFAVNKPFQHPSGLAFRVYDNGNGPEEHVLEFTVPEEFRMRRKEILAQLPAILASVGLSDPANVAQLQGYFPDPAQRQRS